jgi:hypothetical protein
VSYRGCDDCAEAPRSQLRIIPTATAAGSAARRPRIWRSTTSIRSRLKIDVDNDSDRLVPGWNAAMTWRQAKARRIRIANFRVER